LQACRGAVSRSPGRRVDGLPPRGTVRSRSGTITRASPPPSRSTPICACSRTIIGSVLRAGAI
jgi:hypothetical protein